MAQENVAIDSRRRERERTLPEAGFITTHQVIVGAVITGVFAVVAAAVNAVLKARAPRAKRAAPASGKRSRWDRRFVEALIAGDRDAHYAVAAGGYVFGLVSGIVQDYPFPATVANGLFTAGFTYWLMKRPTYMVTFVLGLPLSWVVYKLGMLLRGWIVG